MHRDNPYQSPQSDIRPEAGERPGGSVERALAGTAHWNIGDAISEAWAELSGFKFHYWLALIVYLLVAAFFDFLPLILGMEETPTAFLISLAGLFVSMPLFAGVLMLAVHRAAGHQVDGSDVFTWYSRVIPIAMLSILVSLLTALGMVLLILPGIYLAFAYAYALPLLVEKNMGVWEAMETSRKALTKCWFRYFFLIITLGLLLAVSAIPLGIGLIWTVPLFGLAYGMVYRDLFGVEEESE